MKSCEDYVWLAELNVEGHPVLSQVYASLAIAAAIKENGVKDYPELADLSGTHVDSDKDLQIDDWINSNAKARKED